VANTTTADIDTFRVAWRRRKSFKVIYKAKISNSQSPSPRKKNIVEQSYAKKNAQRNIRAGKNCPVRVKFPLKTNLAMHFKRFFIFKTLYKEI